MNNHGMDDGMMMAPPPSPSSSSSSSHNMTMGSHHKMMMHMTFYWGKEALVLFPGWPGSHTPMYVLALFFTFLLAFLVEGLSRCRLVSADTNVVVSGVVLTVLHALRMGLAYLAMLAIMSFNGGIFIAAIMGHAIGFMLFGSGLFGSGHKGPEDSDPKRPDLPPMSC